MNFTNQCLIAQPSCTFVMKYCLTKQAAQQKPFICSLQSMPFDLGLNSEIFTFISLVIVYQQQLENFKIVRMIIDQKDRLTQTLMNK